MSDVKQFKLPDVGEGLTEAEIVTWKVKPGDTVKVNDVIVEIETAKSLVELPCPFPGTITELLVAEGDTVLVGTPIISVSASGAGAAPAAKAATPTAEAAAAAEAAVPTPAPDAAVEPGLIGGPAPGGRTSVLVGYGPRTTEAKRRPRKGAAVPEDASPAAAQEGVQTTFQPHSTRTPEVAIEDAEEAAPLHAEPASDGGGPAVRKVLAKPPVRKLARSLGVDLGAVTPTGPHGSVTRSDVAMAADGTSTAPGEPTRVVSGDRQETRIPVKGVRKMMAQAMVDSAFTAPHVTEWMSVDATRTVRLVERLRTRPEFRDVKVSPLLVVAKAVCLAARRTPELNARWDEAAQEIVLNGHVNLGIAAATPRGLVVPNIKDADQLSLVDLARALAQLTTTAREGKTQPAEMAGGTFTITNVGVFGVEAGTPIINPGESGILCFGAITQRPWVHRGRVKPRWVTTLAVSFDHRIVDGAQGSRFLADLAAIVEDPATALLF
jgi:pyruvate dehydrogenase E2 component (dihydrolipoamide acetyltransferase)